MNLFAAVTMLAGDRRGRARIVFHRPRAPENSGIKALLFIEARGLQNDFDGSAAVFWARSEYEISVDDCAMQGSSGTQTDGARNGARRHGKDSRERNVRCKTRVGAPTNRSPYRTWSNRSRMFFRKPTSSSASPRSGARLELTAQAAYRVPVASSRRLSETVTPQGATALMMLRDNCGVDGLPIIGDLIVVIGSSHDLPRPRIDNRDRRSVRCRCSEERGKVVFAFVTSN
jgi:hypothetical protein